MKKQLFLIIAVFAICFVTNAQDDDPLYTRAGFKIGLNYSNITGDLEDTDGRIRLHLGAAIEFPVSQRFYIQAELLYSAQGYKFDDNGEDNKISLNYLALPIITKWYVIDKFSFETGPRLASLASSSQSIGEETDEFFNSFSDFDFGWVFGAGYKMESGMFFQAHYNLGLSNINDIDGVDISNNNSIVQLSVGYLFKTKNNRRQEPAVQQ